VTHLEENLAAGDIELSDDDFRQLSQLAHPRGPGPTSNHG